MLFYKSKMCMLGLEFRMQKEWDLLKVHRQYLKEKKLVALLC